MGGSRKLVVEILGDAKGLAASLGESEGHLGKFGSAIGGMAKTAAIGFAAVGIGAIAAAKPLIGAATDLAESMSKVDVVFGDSAKEIKEWSESSAFAFGQSQQSALAAVGTYGNLFQAFGLGRKESTKMSKSLVELAADLASFNNTSVEEALQALQSGVSGETEPLKKYGIAINDVRLKEEALRLGLIKTTKEALTPAAKAQASYALIMKDTTLAQGDFGRTSGGLANQQRILAARFDNLKATLGTALMPVAMKLSGVFMELVGGFTAFIAAFKAGDGEVTSAGLPGFLERLGGIARTVFEEKIKPAFAWLRDHVPPILAAIGDFIETKVIPAIQDLGGWIKAELVPAIMDLWRSFEENILPILRDKVLPVLAQLGEWIYKYVIPAVGELVKFIVGDLIPAFFEVVDFIATKVIPKFVDIVAFITEMPGKIKSAASGMWDGITDAFKAAINTIIRGWNALEFRVPGFKVGPVGYDGFTLGMPDIKPLHSGGTFRSPNGPGTSGMAWLQDGERVSRGGVGGSGVTIIVQGSMIGTERELVSILKRAKADGITV